MEALSPPHAAAHSAAGLPVAPRPLPAGHAWPLGATVDGDSVNFALYAANAYSVDLCLFDDSGAHETARYALAGRSAGVWHGRLPNGWAGAGAGPVYGYRVHGPWLPDRGHRFNRHKLLLDPWAREIVGRFEWRPEHSGIDPRHPQQMDTRDNGANALKARVIDDRFDWQGDHHPLIAPADLVIYEAHVKGFTKLHPDVPEGVRGTYAGMGSPAAVSHLKRMGITAVCLLPVHQHIDEQRLSEFGLSNYWGYNTIGFFCPDPRYATRPDGTTARAEFRGMVRALHAAGIEVILDVVYNHSAEGDEFGPTLSWRGIDNAGSYRLLSGHRAHYENITGCGNTLDIRRPRVLQLVMDSLRYWVQEMHVDGFRFDLATVLGRGRDEFDSESAFFLAVAQDPVLAGVKMIAEPWDIGPGGYQVGHYPRGWFEWNDKFRDTVRAFWLGSDCTRGELAQRLCASSDLFQARNRAPNESVNYVISHDGFSLRDLVSYDMRHNEANGENNRDGHNHNLNWNCGCEGETDDPDVLALRGRLVRALLATNVLAQGTPMLAAGSELGHTQQGNNNPYCQDNAISWLDWPGADADLQAFTARLVALRRELRPLADHWYTGLADARGTHDLTWLRRTGQPLESDHWNNPSRRVLGALIGAPTATAAAGAPGAAARPLLLIFNAEDEDAHFVLPAGRWRALLDTAQPTGESRWVGAYRFPSRSRTVALLARDPLPLPAFAPSDAASIAGASNGIAPGTGIVTSTHAPIDTAAGARPA